MEVEYHFLTLHDRKNGKVKLKKICFKKKKIEVIIKRDLLLRRKFIKIKV